jgi:hypothetical protein
MPDFLFNSPIQHEPYKQNRGILRFPDDIGIPEFMLFSFDSPKPTNDVNEMDHLNVVTYVKGKTKWSPMNVAIWSFIAPSSSQALMAWFRLHHEAATGRDGYAAGYAKNLEFIRLDPTLVETERWICYNCILTGTIDMGGIDYSQSAPSKISFTVQPQRCIQLY